MINTHARTRTHSLTHACAYTPPGPQTRWPEGCSCPISVRQVSEYDSNPSEGRTRTPSALAPHFKQPPCALGPRHTVSKAQSILLLNSAAAFQYGAQWRKHISRPGSGSSYSLRSHSPGFVLLLAPPQRSLLISPSPTGRRACPLSVITMFFSRYRWLLGQHFCLSCWIGDA